MCRKGEVDVDGTVRSKLGNIRMQHESANWLQLKHRKQWSRLLYANPVCFLCTTSTNGGLTNSEPRHNVMVVSWLTATNNTGQFVFSINHRRHTASLLLFPNGNRETPSSAAKIGALFTLSVPVQGMEDMVRSVGQVSGSRVNKFATSASNAVPSSFDDIPCHSSNHHPPIRPLAKNQLPIGEHGIPGLVAIPPVTLCSDASSLVCIDGTVAHMVCRVEQVFEAKDHWLVMAQIEAASVHSSYWDHEKNLFRPLTVGVPPYLSFFGSQTFGYVVTADQMEQWSGQASGASCIE
jgi:flavin reductase (DIM6/NTAB) family NADH-FMN oxidoreductase RutF